MKKLHIFIYIGAMAASPAFAQLNNSVEVTNTVKPVVKDAKKVDVKTQAAETQVKHYTMQYNVNGQQLNQYQEEPLGDYSSEEVWKGNKNGYLQLAGMSHEQVDGEIAYKFNLTDNDALTLDYTLKGYNGKTLENEYYGINKWKSRFYDNRGQVKYNHLFDNGVDFFAKGAFQNQVFNYYNSLNIPGVTDKQHNTIGDFELGITPYQIDKFSIGATGNLKFFNQNRNTLFNKELGETIFQADADLGYKFTEEHAAGLGIEFTSSSYGNDELKGMTHFHFTPHYLYNGEQFNLKLGVFIGTDGDVAPDASFTYHINNKSDAYIIAKGYMEENDFRRFSSMSPYFALPILEKTQMDDEFHQIDARAGYKFNSGKGFGGDINLGYDMSKNHADIAWMTNATNGFYYPLISFTKSKNFYFNADFTYAYKDIVKLDLRHQINIESNKEKDETKWLSGSYIKPMFDMQWKADAKIIKDLYFGIDWQLACFNSPEIDVVGGKAYERPTILNLGASLRYALPINTPLSVFVKGDNLLNQKYDRYYGYSTLGTNVIAGFALSF
ncbi:MAG: hypothetical protein KBT33_04385 [Prevotellaceae bacterium]|nr:hypothetical protein [Candidatus Minthosoma equi]